MLFNPEEIVERGIISGSFKIQTNAIDFTLDSLFGIDNQISYISNDKTQIEHQGRVKLPLLNANAVRRNYFLSSTDDDKTSGWLLSPNTSYDGTSEVYVEVPEGMAAFLIVRSTLNRNAIRLTSGLYDSGYKGHIGFVLHNGVGETFIEQGTCVGQICFIESKNAALYAGGYNNEKGQHWTEATQGKVKPKTKESANPVVDLPIEPKVEDISIVEVVASESVEVITETKPTTTTRRRR